MANADRVKQLFLDLLRINSPSRHERGVADYLKSKLEALGFHVEEDDTAEQIDGDAGNLIAMLPGTIPGARSIFLGAHMDTVEPTDKLDINFDGKTFHSDGSTILGADDKAGIAAIIEGVESIIESGTEHGDIQIIFNVSEEVGLLGSRKLDTSKIKASMGYIFDTQKPAAGITVSAPTHENIIVEITGKAAHAGMAPENGISAIVAASKAIARMNLGRIDFETTANIGVIQGGKARNIVPDQVTIKAEARSRNNDKLTAQVDHMRSVFQQEADAMGAKLMFQGEREYTTFRWTENDDIVKLAVAACGRIGVKPTFQDGGGGSDANTYNSLGIPCVVVGVGYDGAHSHSESIALEDLVTASRFASAIIETAAHVEG
ncbi:MAG: M20/M25/M40 family metallo-hydrolase [Armatimonadota bacterium]|nr:M20/M25/M40 family metallo-hydrolase [bacterium]